MGLMRGEVGLEAASAYKSISFSQILSRPFGLASSDPEQTPPQHGRSDIIMSNQARDENSEGNTGGNSIKLLVFRLHKWQFHLLQPTS